MSRPGVAITVKARKRSHRRLSPATDRDWIRQSSNADLLIKVATETRSFPRDTLNGTAGFPVFFLVVATGNPAPAMTVDPAFTSDGNAGASRRP